MIKTSEFSPASMRGAARLHRRRGADPCYWGQPRRPQRAPVLTAAGSNIGLGGRDNPGLPDNIADNILKLNESRLQALEQYNAAVRKVSELEQQIETMQEEMSRLRAKVNSPLPQLPQAAAAAAPSTAAAPTAPAPRSGGSVATSAGPAITIIYSTGWRDAYIHFTADRSAAWTKPPGMAMANHNGQKVKTIKGSRHLEFVMNNGANDWDSQNKDGNRSNYIADGPGVYVLRDGKCQRDANLKPEDFMQFSG